MILVLKIIGRGGIKNMAYERCRMCTIFFDEEFSDVVHLGRKIRTRDDIPMVLYRDNQ